MRHLTYISDLHTQGHACAYNLINTHMRRRTHIHTEYVHEHKHLHSHMHIHKCACTHTLMGAHSLTHTIVSQYLPPCTSTRDLGSQFCGILNVLAWVSLEGPLERFRVKDMTQEKLRERDRLGGTEKTGPQVCLSTVSLPHPDAAQDTSHICAGPSKGSCWPCTESLRTPQSRSHAMVPSPSSPPGDAGPEELVQMLQVSTKGLQPPRPLRSSPVSHVRCGVRGQKEKTVVITPGQAWVLPEQEEWNELGACLPSCSVCICQAAPL